MSELPTGSVTVDLSAPVATITFGGTKGNSLPGTLLRTLAERIRETSLLDEIQVIQLRSTGDGPFCAGASFAELTSIKDPVAGKEFFMGFARVILAMTQSPKTIVTRVQGKVVGGGVGLVAASDYVIALDTGAVRLSELAVGIGPFVVGPVIERKVGPGAFTAMALDADWRDAAWAERNGLYAQVVSGGKDLDAAVDGRIQQLAGANPEALAKIKAMAWQGTQHWPQLLEERAETSGTLVLSDYTRKALAAFAQRGK